MFQCFRHSDLHNDRPSTAQFKEKLPWFLDALPSADCSKGGHGAYTSSVELKGNCIQFPILRQFSLAYFTLRENSEVQYNHSSFFLHFFCISDHFSFLSDYENGVIQASSFRTYHTPLNKQVELILMWWSLLITVSCLSLFCMAASCTINWL